MNQHNYMAQDEDYAAMWGLVDEIHKHAMKRLRSRIIELGPEHYVIALLTEAVEFIKSCEGLPEGYKELMFQNAVDFFTQAYKSGIH